MSEATRLPAHPKSPGGSKDFSPVAQVVCEFCSLIWIVTVFGACTYLVFWLGHSGWWYVLAFMIAPSWTCKFLRSPEQIRAGKEVEQ